MAHALVERSPLQFDYVPQHGRKVAADAGDSADASSSEQKKTFLVKITENDAYPHKTRIRESATYGNWPKQCSLFQTASIPRAALSRACPEDMAWNGLTDWETGGQLDEGEELSTWLQKKSDYVQARQLRQRNKAGFESLRVLYHEKHGGKEEQEAAAAEADATPPSATESMPDSA